MKKFSDIEKNYYQLSLNLIKPSPENDRLYKPIQYKDVTDLIESIKEHGQLEPIVLSLDNFIISGHRRYKALQYTGLTKAKVKYENIYHSDPEFMTKLVAYNSHRVKNVGEILREEVVKDNNSNPRNYLEEHRLEQSQTDIQTIEVDDSETERMELTPDRQEFIDHVLKVIKYLKEYGGTISLRQIHYKLCNYKFRKNTKYKKTFYENSRTCYQDLSKLVISMRIAKLISWGDIDDETRPSYGETGRDDVGETIKSNLERFLSYHSRNCLQSQPNYIEVVGEKLTVESIIKKSHYKYGVPYTITRGFCSLTTIHAIAENYRNSGKEKLILLFLTDFDPEGEKIIEKMIKSLRDDFSIDMEKVEAVKVAITPDIISGYNLLPNLEAKTTSSNYKWFLDKYKTTKVFELEALDPYELEKLLNNAIESVIDDDLFNEELEIQDEERDKLKAIREKVMKSIGNHFSEN